MIIRIKATRSLGAAMAMALLTGCSAPAPPPLPANNPADADVSVPADAPRNVLGRDETTFAVQMELRKTEAAAKNAEQMSHGDMPGMQQSEKTPPNAEQEKKAIEGEMKKTAEEMKQTSEEIQKKLEQTPPAAFYYTCPMHPEIHQDKPGKCPKCGMTLVKKEGTPPK